MIDGGSPSSVRETRSCTSGRSVADEWQAVFLSSARSALISARGGLRSARLRRAAQQRARCAPSVHLFLPCMSAALFGTRVDLVCHRLFARVHLLLGARMFLLRARVRSRTFKPDHGEEGSLLIAHGDSFGVDILLYRYLQPSVALNAPAYIVNVFVHSVFQRTFCSGDLVTSFLVVLPDESVNDGGGRGKHLVPLPRPTTFLRLPASMPFYTLLNYTGA